MSTHVFAPELTETAIRTALREGHAYVSHDWMCDPSGFWFEVIPKGTAEPGQKVPSQGMIGDEVKFAPGQSLTARFPVSCRIRLLNSGKVVSERISDKLEQSINSPGVYRVEGWLDVAGELRPWIYSNPIYVR